MVAYMSVWKRLQLTLEMIKFEHSVFALPFALTAALLAWRDNGYADGQLWWRLGWITVCMVSARSAAMAFNRILDSAIDAENPRTRMRQIPSGQLSVKFAWAFVIVAAFVFLVSSGQLNPLCFLLAAPALGVLFFYSFTKRFTHYSHVVLGFCLGMAPAAAWIAMRGAVDPRILWLTAAVTLWTAGFDIIYSCQDFAYDQQAGLHSIPSRVGIAKALMIARAMHLAMLACLGLLLASFGLGWMAWIGVAVVAALLAYEHSLVKATDLSRVNAAFFTVNGWVSVLFFVFWATEIVFLRRGA